MKTKSTFLLTLTSLLCILIMPLSHAQSADSWKSTYTHYLTKDHKGNIDTMRVYAWKAFHLARLYQHDSLQVRSLGILANDQSIDSLQSYVAILDTFPRSPYQAYYHSQMLLSYYRLKRSEMPENQQHYFLETMINKADSIYADSTDIEHDRDSKIIYLLHNRLYLSALIESVYLDSKNSPFYEYLERFNRVIEQLPNSYIQAKLNSFITSTSIYLNMGEYEKTLKYSESVVQGILSMPGVPQDFQDMSMLHAGVCYYSFYQQLQCYDHIPPEILARNWAFIQSPYGHQCRDFLIKYGESELTPALFYHMAIKRYASVISKTEKKIQKYQKDKQHQIGYVNLQNIAIRRTANPEKYLDKMFRNFEVKKAYQETIGQYTEVDNANLFAIHKLKTANAQRQLDKETQKAYLASFLFASILAVILFGSWVIARLYKSNKENNLLIRELRHATASTKQEKEEAHRAKQMQTISLDNMNHEIRSPLNSIVGFSELLLDDPDLDQTVKSQFADQIDTSSAMLLQIINDVLNADSLQAGQYTFDRQPLLLCDLCHYATQSIRYRVQSGVRLHTACSFPADYSIVADKTRLLQILLNLLSNACKHTKKGHITLSCTWATPARDAIHFVVTDTGSGVAKDKQPYLFKRFAKLNHEAQGTGLGLNISATLASLMHADLGYDSSYTSGARFYFTLPLGSC